MGFKVSAGSGGGDFTPVPEGTHVGRCIRFVDLGTQVDEWQGKRKTLRKIVLSWEIPSQRTEDDRPMTISKRYTASLGEKATLRADLEAWRGRAFSDAELAGFEMRNILGKPCMLSVTHKTNDGKTRAQVKAILAMPPGVTCAEAENELIFFSMEEGFDADLFEALPDWQKEVISASPEYKEARGSRAPVANGGYDDDDDIPFENPYKRARAFVV
ncbi:MAG: hypothetical protein WDA07_06245 [Leucobacter sp.]